MGIPMVDLAETAADVKEKLADMCAPTIGAKASVPKYPYGTCLSLEDDTLEKLGLDGDLPKVGEMIYFCAVAKVTSASESERETADGGTKKCCRVELQIERMGVQDMDPAERSVAASAARRKRFYKEDDSAEDAA